jgi:hypothetical protein
MSFQHKKNGYFYGSSLAKEKHFRLKFSGILVGNTYILSMFDMFLYAIYEYYNKGEQFLLVCSHTKY